MVARLYGGPARWSLECGAGEEGDGASQAVHRYQNRIELPATVLQS